MTKVRIFDFVYRAYASEDRCLASGCGLDGQRNGSHRHTVLSTQNAFIAKSGSPVIQGRQTMGIVFSVRSAE